MKNSKLTKSLMAIVAVAALATTTFAQDLEPHEFYQDRPAKSLFRK